jgi:hypothetical protein
MINPYNKGVRSTIYGRDWKTATRKSAETEGPCLVLVHINHL